MTRRLISAACAAIVSVLCLNAQGGREDALQKLSSRLSEGTARFGYSFRTKDSQTPFAGEGTAAISGLCYRLVGNGLDIRCDGKTRYTADPASGEMVIEDAGSLEGGDVDFLSNPAVILKNVGSSFKVSGTSAQGGKVLYRLTPLHDKFIEVLTLEFAGELPVKGSLSMQDGSSIEFTISGFEFTSQIFPWTFTKEELAGYGSITDLR